MNNLTLLETILTIYIIVVNVLGVIMIIMPKKVSNIIFYIWIGVTIPITLPVILYELTFDKLKRRKRKQDLEQQFDDLVKENKMMNKAILLSIQPKHLVNILNGNKTLELRKTVPKDFKGWVYIYCTKSKKDILHKYKDKYYTNHYLTFTDSAEVLNRKVVARFWFDEYETLEIDWDLEISTIKISHEELLEKSCVDYNTLNNMFMNENGDVFGYAWHIKKLEIFDEPKSLSDFYKANLYATGEVIKEYEKRTNDFSYRLQRPPQSWQYVYERKEELK